MQEIHNKQLLEMAQRITKMGNDLHVTLGSSRMDWFDDIASELTEMVYVDLSIPARSVDDETGSMVVSYMDNTGVELNELWQRLLALSEKNTTEEGYISDSI